MRLRRPRLTSTFAVTLVVAFLLPPTPIPTAGAADRAPHAVSLHGSSPQAPRPGHRGGEAGWPVGLDLDRWTRPDRRAVPDAALHVDRHATPHVPPDAALGSALDEVLADRRLAGARAGVVVRAADDGRLLYARDPDRRMIPASNQKLLTSAAALEVLGPGYRFATQVLAGGQQRGQVLHGDLYLRGTGDPTMLVADYQRLAAEVARRGIRVVRGGLVADDTWFDDVRLGADWSWEDEEFGYAAPISALTAAAGGDADDAAGEPDAADDAWVEPGTILLEVRPGAAQGAPANVRTVPATNHVTIDNRAVTNAVGSRAAVQVTREHGTNNVVVRGSLPADAAPLTARRSVWDPTGYAAAVFADALATRGVKLLQPARRAATPEAARLVVSRESRPLRELVVPMLKLSINGYAEALIKAMGRTARNEGSAAAGLDALRAALSELGVDTDSLSAADGSGLSRRNLLAPEHLADLLHNVQSEAWFPAWHAALPVAAAPGWKGGTLRARMSNTPAAFNVRAKTGSLTSVSALSGYVTSADGRPMVFVVLLNNFLGPSPKDIEDRIGTTLATSLASTPGAAYVDQDDPAREADRIGHKTA